MAHGDEGAKTMSFDWCLVHAYMAALRDGGHMTKDGDHMTKYGVLTNVHVSGLFPHLDKALTISHRSSFSGFYLILTSSQRPLHLNTLVRFFPSP